jgi:DNA-binding MarR family transcriptional regulator
LRSIFRKSALPVFQTIESAGYQSNEKEGEVKEQVLREAEANRRLLQSLMVNDWLGLEVLFQLTSASQVAQTDLAALVERDDAAVTSTISRLIDSGLVEEAAGKYTCSSFGSELLERVKDVTDHD